MSWSDKRDAANHIDISVSRSLAAAGRRNLQAGPMAMKNAVAVATQNDHDGSVFVPRAVDIPGGCAIARCTSLKTRTHTPSSLRRERLQSRALTSSSSRRRERPTRTGWRAGGREPVPVFRHRHSTSEPPNLDAPPAPAPHSTQRTNRRASACAPVEAWPRRDHIDRRRAAAAGAGAELGFAAAAHRRGTGSPSGGRPPCTKRQQVLARRGGCSSTRVPTQPHRECGRRRPSNGA